MDNIKNTNNTEWVRDRLAELAPASDWEPNSDRGLGHLEAQRRTAQRRHTVRQATVLAALIGGFALLMMPATRGVAERLLNRFTGKSFEAVRLNLGRSDLKGLLPKSELVTRPEGQHRVESLAQAEKEAGFALRFPPEFIAKIATGSIVLGVRGPVISRIRVNVADLRAALRKRGIGNVNIPADWNGVEITQQVSASVSANFKDGTLVQGRPIVVLAPSGFSVSRFFEILFMIGGLSAAEAHKWGEKYSESGGMFAIVPSDARYSFREVAVAGGHGLLFQNDTEFDEREYRCSYCPGPHELVLTWNTPDRIFLLRTDTLSVEEAIALANSIQKP